MLILLSTVFSHYLCQSQTQYQIHTTIKDHTFLQLIYQNILLHTKMLFIIKLVIYMNIHHRIPQIQFFKIGSKLHIGIDFPTDDLKAPSTSLNGSSISVISGITTPFSLHNIDQNDSSVKNVLFFNHTICYLIIQLILKVHT